MRGPGVLARSPRAGAVASALALAVLLVATRATAEPAPVPLAEAPGVVGRIGEKVIAAIAERFAIDARAVPTVVLDGKRFAALYRRISGRPARRISGFAHGGVVYVMNHVFSVNTVVVAHEVLHALSPRFTREARERGYRALIEGVTDHLTHQIAPQRRFDQAGFPRSSYGGYERFARELAAIVGDDVLEACYFDRGFLALERAVDARLGPGRLRRAADLLRRGHPGWEDLLAAR